MLAATLVVLIGAAQIQTDFEPLFREAIARSVKEHGPKHTETAALRGELALHLLAVGKSQDAEELLRSALAVRDDPRWLVSLADLRERAGDYAAATDLYRRALPLQEKATGAASTEVATVANDLALLLEHQGDLDGAEPLYRRALAIREAMDGADNPETATALNNIAGLQRAKGDLGAAEGLYRRALRIFERRFPANHPRIAITAVNLADLQLKQNRSAAAVPLYRRAAVLLRDAGLDYAPDRYAALNGLAFAEREAGNFDTAEAAVREALDLAEQLHGKQSSETAKQCINLAWLLEQRNEHGQARDLYRRALPVAEKELGASHPLVQAVREKVAR
jgi:Tfp pilus assembly protein PilF